MSSESGAGAPRIGGRPRRSTRPSRLPAAAATLLAILALAPVDASEEPALARVDRELRAVFERSAGSVYKIASSEPGRSGWSRVGSGFVIEGTAGIVTTEDLVAGATHAYVWIDGEAEQVPVIGSDPMLNVALLAMPERGDAAGLSPGDSKEIQAGSFVVGIGCAGDFGPEPVLGLVGGRRFGVFHLGGLPAWHLRKRGLDDRVYLVPPGLYFLHQHLPGDVDGKLNDLLLGRVDHGFVQARRLLKRV